MASLWNGRIFILFGKNSLSQTFTRKIKQFIEKKEHYSEEHETATLSS